jgi:hypothetical protein
MKNLTSVRDSITTLPGHAAFHFSTPPPTYRSLNVTRQVNGDQWRFRSAEHWMAMFQRTGVFRMRSTVWPRGC